MEQNGSPAEGGPRGGREDAPEARIDPIAQTMTGSVDPDGSHDAATPAHRRGMPYRPSALPKWRNLNPYIARIEDVPDRIVSFEAGYGLKGRWQSRFPAPQPLYLELGSGMGHFLTDLAERCPERNFIGLEIKYKRLFKSAEKAQQRGLSNVQYLRFDALQIEHAFAPGELSGVYINFPDPWPKSHQVDKRMVSPFLVAQLEQLLPPGAKVQLKSDWEPYREIFPEAFEGSAFVRTGHIADLGAWDREEANILTSYERRFRAQGLPCFFYEYTRQTR